MARIWTQVLGIEQLGIHDNFFKLGGHSLQATQVVVQVREVFRVKLPLRSLFEAPTVDGLVSKMAALWGERAVVDEIARIFTELEQLSEDEIKMMLAQ